MLVDIDDLKARLPFEMDADEEREAQGALDDLSFEAQATGSAAWTDEANTPPAAKNLILRAAARHMKNYEGYTVSRAGDETTQWAEQDTPGSATFTDDEKRMLRVIGGRTPFIGGVGAYAWGKKTPVREGLVPVVGGSPFPMYASGTEPW